MATKCPISRATFEKTADKNSIKLVIDGKEYVADSKDADRKEGKASLGWGINERGSVKVDGVDCPAMIQVNVTLIGSKVKS